MFQDKIENIKNQLETQVKETEAKLHLMQVEIQNQETSIIHKVTNQTTLMNKKSLVHQMRHQNHMKFQEIRSQLDAPTSRVDIMSNTSSGGMHANCKSQSPGNSDENR